MPQWKAHRSVFKQPDRQRMFFNFDVFINLLTLAYLIRHIEICKSLSLVNNSAWMTSQALQANWKWCPYDLSLTCDKKTYEWSFCIHYTHFVSHRQQSITNYWQSSKPRVCWQISELSKMWAWIERDPKALCVIGLNKPGFVLRIISFHWEDLYGKHSWKSPFNMITQAVLMLYNIGSIPENKANLYRMNNVFIL